MDNYFVQAINEIINGDSSNITTFTANIKLNYSGNCYVGINDNNLLTNFPSPNIEVKTINTDNSFKTSSQTGTINISMNDNISGNIINTNTLSANENINIYEDGQIIFSGNNIIKVYDFVEAEGNHIYRIPNCEQNANFILTDGDQNINGFKTFTNPLIIGNDKIIFANTIGNNKLTLNVPLTIANVIYNIQSLNTNSYFFMTEEDQTTNGTKFFNGSTITSNIISNRVSLVNQLQNRPTTVDNFHNVISKTYDLSNDDIFSNTLAISNGGIGSNNIISSNIVDLSSAQSIYGFKQFDGAIKIPSADNGILMTNLQGNLIGSQINLQDDTVANILHTSKGGTNSSILSTNIMTIYDDQYVNNSKTFMNYVKINKLTCKYKVLNSSDSTIYPVDKTLFVLDNCTSLTVSDGIVGQTIYIINIGSSIVTLTDFPKISMATTINTRGCLLAIYHNGWNILMKHEIT